MTGLAAAFAWCSLQVTLVAILAWLLCSLARRFSPSHAAALPATALAAVIVLTGLAFVPWPSAWSYGPDLSWNAESVVPEDARLKETTAGPPRTETSLPAAPDVSSLPATLATLPELVTPATKPADEPAANPATVTTRDDLASPAPTAPTPAVAPPSPPLPSPWPWPSILLSLLAAGAAAGLLQLLLGLAAAQSYRRNSCLIEDKKLQELAEVLCAKLRCRSKVELRETSALTTAATIGWTKPLVLLPLEWRDWTAEQLSAVLAHEIAHIARHDFPACVLAQASLALHFYHPLVHWLVRRLRLEQELAADAAAAVATGGRAAYLAALAELALRQSERPLGWPARTFLPTRGTFMRRIEMLRDAKNGPAGESRWLTWPRRTAVLLLIAGAVAIAGLRGTAPPSEVVQAQDKPKPKSTSKVGDETKAAEPDTGEISVAQLPGDCLAFAAIRIQPLLNHPETAEVLQKLDQRTAASKAAVPLEKISQITFAMRSNTRLQGQEPVIIVETSEAVDFSKTLLAEEGREQVGLDEVKEADLQTGIERPTIVFTRLNDRAAAFGNRQTLANYFAHKRGAPPLARGDGWKKVASRPLVFAIDMMALRRLVPAEQSPAQTLTSWGLMPFWDETESIAIGVTLDKKADVRLVAECLGEKGAAEVERIADNGAVAIRRILREMRTARLKQVADNVGARTIEEPEFVQLLYDAADKALSNVKAERQESLIVASAAIDLKGRVGALGALVPSIDAMRMNSRRVESANNIKQIMLAMHNYADTYRHFPPAVIYGRDGKGKVPHSWRVELLPFLDQAALYNAYQFDEPWDSEANKKVLAQMPAVFRDPSADPKSTNSAYYVMVGKRAEAKERKPRGGEDGGLGAAGGAAGLAGPPGGGAPGAAGALGGAPGEDSVERRFDATVIKYVDEVLLKQNDKDGDGQLSGEEIKGAKWSNDNPPENSDLDMDGILDRAELCQRISLSRGIPFKEAAAAVVVDTNLPTAFSKKRGIGFAEILDGTSNTIAVVEAKRDIPWTNPEDIAYDPKGKAPKLGGFYDDGFWVGICDGSVQFLPGNISEDSLRAYLSPAAGDQIAPQKPAGVLEIRPVPVPADKPTPRSR